MFSAVSNESNGLHAGVRKRSITSKLWQTLDSILKGIDGGGKVFLEYSGWKKQADRRSWWKTVAEYETLKRIISLCDCPLPVAHYVKELQKQQQRMPANINIPVVWKASSTIPSSSSEAARWKTEKTFFHPDLILWACECTICATQRTTMSRIVADLWLIEKKLINVFLEMAQSKAKH